jgi:hypothetical protein
MQLTKIISTEIDKVARRVVKFLRFGLKDTQTALQVGPYGVDAHPIKDMIALYGPTSEKGDTVIIGYINKNALAAIGEHRIFSTDADGAVKTFIWLKNDGAMQLGGTAKNLVRFQELEDGFNQLRDDLNSFIQQYNTFAVAYIPGGPSVVGSPPTAPQGTASNANITGAKIDEITTL